MVVWGAGFVGDPSRATLQVLPLALILGGQGGRAGSAEERDLGRGGC